MFTFPPTVAVPPTVKWNQRWAISQPPFMLPMHCDERHPWPVWVTSPVSLVPPGCSFLGATQNTKEQKHQASPRNGLLLNTAFPQMSEQWGGDCRRGHECWLVSKEGPNCLSNLPGCQTDGQPTEHPIGFHDCSYTAEFLQLNQA